MPRISMYALSEMLKRILTFGLLLCVVPSALANEYLYFTEDSALRSDPSKTAAIQTIVSSGTPILLSTCDETGWCFGKVYDLHEGWVLRAELDVEPPFQEVNHQLSGSSTNAEDRAHHLADTRNLYFLVSSMFSSGSSSLRTESGVPVGKSKSSLGAVGLGWHQKFRQGRRFDTEVLFGISYQRRQPESDSTISESSAWLGLGVKYLQPDNEIFGVGFELRPMLRLSSPKGLLKNPSALMLSLGPIFSHDFGTDRLVWAVWRPSLMFNSRELFFGLGLDINF